MLTILIADESAASVIRRVRSAKKGVLRAALTFDDGPKAEYTEELLAVLREKGVKATFFLLGCDVLMRPDDAKKITADGHVIANHSMTHRDLKTMPFDEICNELRDCSNLLESITGKRPRFMRPPGGQYNADLLRACETENLVLVLWTNNPGDYREEWKTANALSRQVNKLRSNGDIILLHLGLPLTVEALPAIIDSYHRAGFKFVTIDDI